ncbi:MAG: spermidine/putrescine ABC transporter substrate-binding protein [Clostridiales bacterium]|nr:MAG: spermidine/putrescine ABC transporter substrate-binding protein [Clostridiales bacterium]
MRNMKRLIAAFAALTLLVLSMSGCKKYGPNEILYVYNWGEYIDKSVNKKFQQETGIKVVYKIYDNNEAMYAVVKNAPGTYDVVFPSDYMVARMIEENMLEQIDFSNIPNFQYIMDEFKNLNYDPENLYSVPYTWGTVGLLYNTQTVTQKPDSWNALWDSSYAGKILMYNNSRDTLGIALLKEGYSLNTTDEAELRAANAELIRQKPYLQAYVSDEIFSKMEGASAAICPVYSGDAITMMEENPDLAYTVPKEGTNRFVDCACIMKDAPNKEAAEKYINFLCRQDIAELNRAFTAYSTPQQQVYEALEDEIKNNVIAYPDAQTLANTEIFTNLPQKTLELYNTLWDQLKNA